MFNTLLKNWQCRLCPFIDGFNTIQMKECNLYRRRFLGNIYRFNFLGCVIQVRELLSWAGETEREMATDTQVRDVQSVELLKTRHEQLKAEIEARDDTFNAIVQAGQEMVNNGHFAREEVST